MYWVLSVQYLPTHFDILVPFYLADDINCISIIESRIIQVCSFKKQKKNHWAFTMIV